MDIGSLTGSELVLFSSASVLDPDPFLFQDEKEQLAEFQTHLEVLKRRAKTVVQLKPRNPASATKGKLPVQAVCDFKQMEVSSPSGPVLTRSLTRF